MVALHSPKHLGNTRSCPTGKFMCLVGLGCNDIPVTLSCAIYLEQLEVRVPPADAIVAANGNGNALLGLNAPKDSLYDRAPVFLPAP